MNEKFKNKNIGTIELGDTGTRRYSGYSLEEFIPELQSKNGAEIYDEMRKNDSTINGILTIMNQLFYNVRWEFVTKGTDNDSEKKKRIIETIFSDMEKPFSQVLSDVLTFLPFGYSLLEIVWKKRNGKNKDSRFNSKFNDGIWGIRKLPLRSQKTIYKWDFDESGTPIAAVQQIPLSGKTVRIPMDKLLHFRTTTEADLPDGVSILRGSYECYQFQKKIKRIEAVSIERELAGIPILRLPSEFMQADAPPEQRKIYEAIKQYGLNIRKNSQAAIMLPSDTDEKGQYLFNFELVKSSGQKQVDTNSVIERYQSDIAVQMLADFTFMGAKKAGGTFNLAEVKIKLFAQSLNYYLDVVQSVFNTKLIPQIYENNGWEINENICEIRHGKTDTIDFEILSNSIMKLVQVGAITPDPTLETYLRNQGNIPLLGHDEERLS